METENAIAVIHAILGTNYPLVCMLLLVLVVMRWKR